MDHRNKEYSETPNYRTAYKASPRIRHDNSNHELSPGAEAGRGKEWVESNQEITDIDSGATDKDEVTVKGHLQSKRKAFGGGTDKLQGVGEKCESDGRAMGARKSNDGRAVDGGRRRLKGGQSPT